MTLSKYNDLNNKEIIRKVSDGEQNERYMLLPEEQHNQHWLGPKEQRRNNPNHQFGLRQMEPCNIKSH